MSRSTLARLLTPGAPGEATAGRAPRGHDVGVRAGPDPRYEGACELRGAFQGQAAAAESFPVAGPFQVYLDQARRVGAGDDVLDVPRPFGAQFRVWLFGREALRPPPP